MSFYSSLVLAANEGVRRPTSEQFHSLLEEFGLLKARYSYHEFGGSLADNVTDLSHDPAAITENPHFFCPDSIDIWQGVQVLSWEGEYAGPGWSVTFHGNGYFYPWGLSDLRDRAVRLPPLSRLRTAIQERFGGQFVFPAADENFLREQLIDGDSGWLWFGSESG